MKKHYRLIASTVALTTLIPASAATNFDNESGGLVSVAGNWNNGLPTAENPGTISMNATADSTTLDGYDLTHTDGTLSNTGTTSLALGTAAYTLDGASAQISGFRNITNTAGGVFTVENGSVSLASATDSSFGGAFTVNGGTVTVSRRLTAANTSGGSITINGGVVSSSSAGTDNNIGGNNLGKGDFFLNGGDIDFRFMQVGNGELDFFFGGSKAGNLTIENFGGFRHKPEYVDLDFATGSLMSLTLTNPVAFDDPTGDDRFGWADDNDGPFWAEALWSDGRLTFDDQSYSDLVLSWAQASNPSIGLGGGYYWDYSSTTNTLALGYSAVPEPTGAVAGLLLGLGLLQRRRPRR